MPAIIALPGTEYDVLPNDREFTKHTFEVERTVVREGEVELYSKEIELGDANEFPEIEVEKKLKAAGWNVQQA